MSLATQRLYVPQFVAPATHPRRLFVRGCVAGAIAQAIARIAGGIDG
jgi:hypothetical protein